MTKTKRTSPTRSEIRGILLATLLKNDGKTFPSVVYSAIEDKYPQRTRKQMSNLQYATRFTRKALVVEGLISATTRGVWALTANGRKAAAKV